MPDTTPISMLRALFAHAAWANAAVISGLRSTAGTDPHAVEQLAHLLGAEHVWLSRVQGVPTRVAVWPSMTIDACHELATANAAAFDALLAPAEADTLEREITYTNSAGLTFSNRVLDILLHVALHGAYHRGMTSILTRRSGGTPTPTDFIAFVRGVPTATRADADRSRGK